MKFTKFIKITTQHNEEELQSLLSSLSHDEVEELKKIYHKFDFAEFQQNECVCMFASIHQNYIKDLLDVYVKLKISFQFEDLTKEALFGMITESTSQIEFLVKKFIEDNIEMDDVLDKINELGISSLTLQDYAVLEKV